MVDDDDDDDELMMMMMMMEMSSLVTLVHLLKLHSWQQSVAVGMVVVLIRFGDL